MRPGPSHAPQGGHGLLAFIRSSILLLALMVTAGGFRLTLAGIDPSIPSDQIQPVSPLLYAAEGLVLVASLAVLMLNFRTTLQYLRRIVPITALLVLVFASTLWSVDAGITLVEGMHYGGGEPFALEHRLIALSAVPDAAQESFADEAPGTWLLHHVPWTAARHRIRAVEATAAEAKALGLRPRGACLELERTTWRAGQVVTHVRQLFRGDRYDLVAEFRP